LIPRAFGRPILRPNMEAGSGQTVKAIMRNSMHATYKVRECCSLPHYSLSFCLALFLRHVGTSRVSRSVKFYKARLTVCCCSCSVSPVVSACPRGEAQCGHRFMIFAARFLLLVCVFMRVCVERELGVGEGDELSSSPPLVHARDPVEIFFVTRNIFFQSLSS
jgi:hypothetical protein